MDPKESFEQFSQHDIEISKSKFLKESLLQTFDFWHNLKFKKVNTDNFTVILLTLHRTGLGMHTKSGPLSQRQNALSQLFSKWTVFK